MCAGPFKPPKPPKITPPPAPPPIPAPVEPALDEAADLELRRQRGRASTLFTGPYGLTSTEANVATRALTG